ncbi:MAG: FAD-binding oxidoreductase [Alphaproteobacteria bacterium]|nr:FAD-binding oxidoreductase [Alphaproteobacteria bacterium]
MARADVLVIGGGLAGCAAAYFLARGGADVLVIEQHDLNTLASGSNAGSLHGQMPYEEFIEKGEDWAAQFAPVLSFLLEAIRYWPKIEAELGADFEVSLCGGLLLAETEDEMRAVERKARVERAHGVDVELLSRDDLQSVAPYVSDQMVGAALYPLEGTANPLLATPAFAAAAQRNGVRIMRRTTLDGLHRDGGGFTAKTRAGPIAARRVVNCAGASAGRVAAMIGLELPIDGYPIQVNVTEPAAPLVTHLVYATGGRLTLKQTPRGAFLIGGGWPGALDPENGRPVVDVDSVRDNLRVAATVVPSLRRANLLRTWPAIVNGTDDWRPIIGEAPGVPGFFLCMVPWVGFTAGPFAARLVADLVLGRRPGFNLAPISSPAFAA